MLAFAAIGFVVAAVVVLKAIKVVPNDTAYVIERLGKHFDTAKPGVLVLLPFLDRVAFRYSLLPQEKTVTERAITYDNVPVAVTTSIRWQIADAGKAAYASANAEEYALTLVRTRLREAIGTRKFDDARETTREIEAAVMRAVADPAAAGGVKIAAVDVQKIDRG